VKWITAIINPPATRVAMACLDDALRDAVRHEVQAAKAEAVLAYHKAAAAAARKQVAVVSAMLGEDPGSRGVNLVLGK